MKSTRIGLIVAVALAVGAQVHANTGIFDAFAIVSDTNNGNLKYYDLPPSVTGNPDFSGFNFGTFNLATDFLTLNGGQVKTFEDNNDTVSGARFYWRIYE